MIPHELEAPHKFLARILLLYNENWAMYLAHQDLSSKTHVEQTNESWT